MDWKKCAANDLQRYESMAMGLVNLKDRIELIKNKLETVSSHSAQSVPMKGGGNIYEDRVTNLIVEKDRLEMNYAFDSQLCEMIERGLETLDETQRLTLTRFYINGEKRCAERLGLDLGYESSQIYRIRDRALHKFTLAMYGMIES